MFAAFRLLGGVPTYVLTDNEKSVTVEHVARISVRNQQVVAFARFYGVTVHTCEVRDPASKGGVENTVKLAKADIVSTDTNLAEEYACFEDPGCATRRCSRRSTSTRTTTYASVIGLPTTG